MIAIVEGNWVVIDLIAAGAIAIVLSLVQTNIEIQKDLKRSFILALVAALLTVLAEVSIVLFGELTLFNVIGFLLTPFIPIFIVSSFFKGKKKLIVFLPSVINGILALLSPFTGAIFSVSPTYKRGNFFLFFCFSFLWGIVIAFIILLKLQLRYKDVPKRVSVGMMLFLLLGTSFQIFFPKIHASWCCVAFSIVIGYIFLEMVNSSYDSLTQVHSRKAYQVALNDAKVVVIFVVDCFKTINDTYGHPYGDESLRTVAYFIKESFKDDGVCYRIGGDEFCVLLKTADKHEACLATFKYKILEKQKEDEHFPSVSYGFDIKEEGDSIISTLYQADLNLYKAKRLYKTVKESTK